MVEIEYLLCTLKLSIAFITRNYLLRVINVEFETPFKGMFTETGLVIPAVFDMNINYRRDL